MAGIGGIVGKAIDLRGLLKGLIGQLYQWAFSEEIAAQAAERKKVLEENEALRKQVLEKVQADQDQIDTAELEKAPILEKIAVEQKIQKADEAKIAEVKVEEQKAVDAISKRSDDQLLHDDF